MDAENEIAVTDPTGHEWPDEWPAVIVWQEEDPVERWEENARRWYANHQES